MSKISGACVFNKSLWNIKYLWVIDVEDEAKVKRKFCTKTLDIQKLGEVVLKSNAKSEKNTGSIHQCPVVSYCWQIFTQKGLCLVSATANLHHQQILETSTVLDLPETTASPIARIIYVITYSSTV